MVKLSSNLFYILFGISFGFYDGFFGPGVGSFWAIAFVVVMGFSLTEATGYTKAMNFTSNIVIKIGAVMAAGQIFSSLIGARLAILLYIIHR